MVDWQHLEQQMEPSNKAGRNSVARIRELILEALRNGALKPGVRLKEVELGKALKVSRTPLREALAGLRGERIVETDREGVRIRTLDWADVRNLYELRGTLEAMAARLAATRASKEEKHLIRNLVVEEQSLVASSAPAVQLAAQNRRFHRTIAKAAANSFLEEHLDQLSQLLVLLGATAYSLESRLNSILAEHEQINSAIQRGSPDDAETAMRSHLEAALVARLHLISQTAQTEMD